LAPAAAAAAAAAGDDKINKGSMSMFSMSAKLSGEEIIEECKKELEEKTQVLNLMTSALEFSEIDRFNAEVFD
jgi:hypothetical protein